MTFISNWRIKNQSEQTPEQKAELGWLESKKVYGDNLPAIMGHL